MPQPEASPQLTPARLYDDWDDDPRILPDVEGLRFRSKATVFAVISIFFLGVIFGPLAIMYAGKAEALGVPATFGKSCGWIVLILSGLGLFYAAVVFTLPLISA